MTSREREEGRSREPSIAETVSVAKFSGSHNPGEIVIAVRPGTQREVRETRRQVREEFANAAMPPNEPAPASEEFDIVIVTARPKRQ